jgi:hypothetical protein
VRDTRGVTEPEPLLLRVRALEGEKEEEPLVVGVKLGLALFVELKRRLKEPVAVLSGLALPLAVEQAWADEVEDAVRVEKPLLLEVEDALPV